MSNDKTHTEIRNMEVNRELIEITDEMQSAMQDALEADAQRFDVDDAPAIDDRRNNFRPYDQLVQVAPPASSIRVAPCVRKDVACRSLNAVGGTPTARNGRQRIWNKCIGTIAKISRTQ